MTFVKHDQAKPALDLVPPEAILAVADVVTYGAKKYGRDNWRTAQIEDHARYYAAAMRHLLAYRQGQWSDDESGLPHLAHAACCLFFLLVLDAPRVKAEVTK